MIFNYESEGKIIFDPGVNTVHYEPFWCLLMIDSNIAEYYRWFLKKEKIETHPPNKLWNFHSSIIKHEEPQLNKDKWGIFEGQTIKFKYGNYISFSNGKHAWLNLISDDLNDIRSFYGLQNSIKIYHMTLGRLKIELKII